MGIPGILKEIGKGERIALSKLAIEHFERHNRPLRIAVDAAIWNFQTASGQGGKNPALRTLFFRLLRLLALPVQPVFVYDGKDKPLTKRGRTVTRYHGTCVPNELSKGLVSQFCYPWHVAPGEAEAECALLQKKGIVDMVMSQDADAIMFGAGITLRDWSKEGTRGNKAPTHVNVMSLLKLKEISGLDSDGMILVALLSGGDYDEAGVAGFGATLACEIARAGFGKDLIDLVNKKDWDGLKEWRQRLQYELETNESGYFKRRHKKLPIPDNFPDLKILSYYTSPAVSSESDLPSLEDKWSKLWKSSIDVSALRDYTGAMFDWRWRSGARRFVRCFAQPYFQSQLLYSKVNSTFFSVDNISERRKHFTNDGIPELRFSAVPAEVVGIDIEAEEENPEYVVEHDGEAEEDGEISADVETADVDGFADEQPAGSQQSVRRKKTQPWDAYTSEKWWIPETLLQLGLPHFVEDWHQLQRDLRADPKKFATRRIAKPKKSEKQIDANMRTGAIHGFFTNVVKQSKINEKFQAPLQGDSASIAAKVSATRGKPRNIADLDPYKNSDSNTESIVSVIHGSETEVLQHTAAMLSQKHACPSTPESSHTSPDRDGRDKINNGQRTERESTPHKSSQSGSFSDAILIESSPQAIADTSVPHEPDGMEHVTQRKPRRTRRCLEKSLSDLTSGPTRMRRPIESFFARSKEDRVDIDRRQEFSKDDMAVAPSMSLSRMSRKLKSTALARDSLPGSWKELDTDTGPASRPPRISYVDLTSD